MKGGDKVQHKAEEWIQQNRKKTARKRTAKKNFRNRVQELAKAAESKKTKEQTEERQREGKP